MDFDTLAGPSTHWVSAFVALALARSRQPDGLAAALETWARLRRARWWSAGWGFNDRVPSDADSTIWVLHLGAALGAGRNGRALRFLSRHITRAGGVRTFASGWAIGAYTRLSGWSFAGWCSEHACVSAAAATLPDLPDRQRVLAWLREAQCADGGWISYWWESRHYATAMAAETLAMTSNADDVQRVARAAHWAARDLAERDAAVSPFERAFALRTLLAGPSTSAAAASTLARLVDSQLADGSWIPSARLRIPPPHVADPDRYESWIEQGGGGGSVQSDRHACFTTAAVLMALAAVRTTGEQVP